MNALSGNPTPRRHRGPSLPAWKVGMPRRARTGVCDNCRRVMRGLLLTTCTCGNRGMSKTWAHVNHDDGWHPKQRGPRR